MPHLAEALRFLFSRTDGVRSHLIARWLFLRSLGLVFFSAFFALILQAPGLIGSHGILPAAPYLQALRPLGPERFWYAPSLLWLNTSDAAIATLCWLGLLASILLILNIAPRAAILVCTVCFLSFTAAAQDFSSYQSDGMLLEAGFLALFVAPAGLRPRLGAHSLPTRAAYFLLLWEWFRIYFESGVVKLASGDPTWRNLTAMYEYYQNGPLPTWIGWYLQHLPHAFHIATAALTLVMELFIVWLAFLSRRLRIVCFWIVTVWQIGVISTANYAFLNYLVLVLAFLLLDDQHLAPLLPAIDPTGSDQARDRHPERSPSALSTDAVEGPRGTRSPAQTSSGSRENEPLLLPSIDPEPPGAPFLSQTHRERSGTYTARLTPLLDTLSALLLTWVFYATTLPLLQMFFPAIPLPSAPIAALEPLRIANTYGLFANMTPHRYEIEFQGSPDGHTWTPYPFRFKPQDPHGRPRIYAPYQPRFDWNLWFCSLGTWRDNSIVPRTEELLLENDPAVLSLFAGNPFALDPPKFVRAVLWQYWFSTPAEKRSEHVWWRRQLLGTYAPTLTRLPDGRLAVTEAPTLTSAAP